MSLNHIPGNANSRVEGDFGFDNDSYFYVASSGTESIGTIGPNVGKGEVYEFRL